MLGYYSTRKTACQYLIKNLPNYFLLTLWRSYGRIMWIENQRGDFMEKIISFLNDALYSYVLIILLVLGGIYFTIRSKAVQFKTLPTQFKVVMEKPSDKKGV